MNTKILLLSVALALVILPTTAYASGGIPDWVKTSMGWYSENRISDSEFMETLQFLLDEGIINAPQKVIIKEVQAEPMNDNHDSIWKSINVLQEELDSWSTQWNDRLIYKEMSELRAEIQRVDFEHGDAILEINRDPVDQNPDIDWERRYNELWELYDDLSLRVVDLERENLG